MFRESKIMRRLALFFVTLGMVCLADSPLFAGAIINKSNQSADYLRTLNRHAATDYADAAVYNPAGIMKFDDGFKLKADVMYFNKEYSHTVPSSSWPLSDSGGHYEATSPSILPGFFATYKQNRWGWYFACTTLAGAGQLNYKNGSARAVKLANEVITGIKGGWSHRTTGAWQETYNYYNQNFRIDDMIFKVEKPSVFGYTLGGAYKINDTFAVSLGLRYADGTRDIEGRESVSWTALWAPRVRPLDFNFKIEQEADGWAGIVGLNITPIDKLNLGLTYISNTELEYENKVAQDTTLPNGRSLAAEIGFADGDKQRIDIPASLALGASYRVLPKLKLDFNGVYYFEKNAQIDTFKDEGDSWELGLAAEYRFNPMWMVSIGYLHSEVNLDDDQQINEPEEPKLDANTLGLGFVVNPLPKLALTFSGAKVWYDAVTDSNGIKYEKDSWVIATGIQWSFPN